MLEDLPSTGEANRGDVALSEPTHVPGRGFLGRWSERKTAARETVVEAARSGRGGAAPVLAEQSADAELPELYHGDERPLTEEEEAVVATLPDIESLDAESDFTPFMQANVPEFVRRRALRALWRLNPILANVDGLVDYGDDFTDAATVIEGLQTAYKVGRGFLTDDDLGIEPDSEEDSKPAGSEEAPVAAMDGSQSGPEQGAADEDAEDDVGDGDLV